MDLLFWLFKFSVCRLLRTSAAPPEETYLMPAAPDAMLLHPQCRSAVLASQLKAYREIS